MSFRYMVDFEFQFNFLDEVEDDISQVTSLHSVDFDGKARWLYVRGFTEAVGL